MNTSKFFFSSAAILLAASFGAFSQDTLPDLQARVIKLLRDHGNFNYRVPSRMDSPSHRLDDSIRLKDLKFDGCRFSFTRTAARTVDNALPVPDKNSLPDINNFTVGTRQDISFELGDVGEFRIFDAPAPYPSSSKNDRAGFEKRHFYDCRHIQIAGI